MKKLGYILVLIILMSSFISAGISILEPSEIYSLGDRIYIDLDGLRGTESGNLNINLACGNKTTNLVKIPARSFSSGQPQPWSVPYKILNKEDLEVETMEDVIGECKLIVSLGTEIASTKTFTISKDISIDASLDKGSYNPGESVMVNIKATKANGELLSGFVEGSNASDFNKAIEDGSVDEIFAISETAEAGVYFLNINAYDTDRSGVLNEAFFTVSFIVNQVASSIIMSLSNTEVVPGENFTIGAEIFDQSGNKMNVTVPLTIISPENEEIKKNVRSGEFVNINFPLNSSVGIWKVVGSFDNTNEEREFEILGVQKIQFDFEDSILIVTNIGNVLYNKTISVQIGTEYVELKLEVNVGEVKKFNLKAPNGKYNVSVNDGESSVNQQIPLSGKVISVDSLRDIGVFKGFSIIWIFLILIVVIVSLGVVFFIKNRKTKTIGESGLFNKFSKKIGIVKNKIPVINRPQIGGPQLVQKLSSKNYNKEDKNIIDMTKTTSGTAESTLVLKGEKYKSAVVALSVKNYNSLDEITKKSLHDIVSEAGKRKGLIDWRGDYIFIVFSPLITKTYNNEILAVKTGKDILNKLNEHNKKFNGKIEFNIGVHIGELIASKTDGKLKYTSIGNTISFSKRISDSDTGKLIISEEIRKKLLRDLKVSKNKEIGEKQTYNVSEIKDKSGNEARLKDLLKRMK